MEKLSAEKLLQDFFNCQVHYRGKESLKYCLDTNEHINGADLIEHIQCLYLSCKENGYIEGAPEKKMLELNYTNQGKRPSARQILSDWKKSGRPIEFTAEYGETYAHFIFSAPRWFADGNGCSGIKRDEVERLLNLAIVKK